MARATSTKVARAAGAGGAVTALATIIVFLSGIQTSIDRNCQATSNLAKATVGVIAADKDLSKPQNEQLRKFLVSSTRGITCK